MMTLNNNEKDFQEKLQKDTEMPAIVHERINQAYRLIENNAVLQKKSTKGSISLDENWRQDSRRDGSGTGSRICILCNQSGNGKNIPVVGGLFEILQDNVSFFGDFSDHATTLEAVDGTKTDSSETDGPRQIIPIMMLFTLRQQMG